MCEHPVAASDTVFSILQLEVGPTKPFYGRQVQDSYRNNRIGANKEDLIASYKDRLAKCVSEKWRELGTHNLDGSEPMLRLQTGAKEEGNRGRGAQHTATAARAPEQGARCVVLSVLL